MFRNKVLTASLGKPKCKRLPLIHFSPQPEPILITEPTQYSQRIPQNLRTLSWVLDGCNTLAYGVAATRAIANDSDDDEVAAEEADAMVEVGFGAVVAGEEQFQVWPRGIRASRYPRP